MLPFYKKAISDGISEEELTELLAGFFMKTNEICGRGAWNYKAKPVLCQSSKQYINIGGERPNEFSKVVLKALAVSYFKLGGFHVGISVVNAETLKDAMKNPDKYKSLTVRLYGFSEYFVSLPKWQQMAVLNRTQYKV